MAAKLKGLAKEHGDVTWIANIPRSPVKSVAAFIGFAAQVKPAQFENVRASPLHTLPFGFNPGDAAETHGIGV